MKKLVTTLFLGFLALSGYACHQVTISQVSATDNGDGTYTYEFEVCMGTEDTWGFYLDFYGGGSIVGNQDSVTASSTGVTIGATVPPQSGTGDIEYGDWDDDSGPVFSGATNDCPNVTVTFDAPIDSAEIGGTQLNYSGGPCSGSTMNNTVKCGFPPSYTIDINEPSCANKTYDVDLNGNPLISNVVTDGSSITYYYCGGCVSTFSAVASSGGCSMGSWSVTDSAGNVKASGSGDVSGATVSDCTLPVELCSASIASVKRTRSD